uniref:Pyrin domain-containing protein n=1 Tax=Anabas testudineus TaxID=64144 RepID=A0A7N6FBU1_ANATE
SENTGKEQMALEDLSKIDFDKFSHRLLDYPEIRRRAVEGKSFLQITELLVSTFPGARALKVTLEILRLINCNEVQFLLGSVSFHTENLSVPNDIDINRIKYYCTFIDIVSWEDLCCPLLVILG